MAKRWRLKIFTALFGRNPGGDMTPTDIWHRLGRVAKAFASGIAAGLSYLVGVWGEQATVSEAFSALTAQQWGLFTLALLGGWGVTYRTRNR